MNTTSPAHEADDLDRILSGFFKAQLRHPWPKAPLPAVAASQPSEFLASRSSEALRSAAAAPPSRNHTARARFTLAASVALALGAGWLLTAGLHPVARTGGPAAPASGPGMLGGSEAQGIKGGALDQMRKDKMNDLPRNNRGLKFDLGKGE
ncbi:MAG: hypothetical protein ACKODX_06610 [Gemmata sp.]